MLLFLIHTLSNSIHSMNTISTQIQETPWLNNKHCLQRDWMTLESSDQ